jgi:hypothetical protein
MRRPKILAFLLGTMGASGAILASAPAHASFGPSTVSSSHEEQVAFHSAQQARSIEALEDFLWRFPEGKGNSELRMKAIYELAKFECVGSPQVGGNGGCAPDGSALGHDAKHSHYAG